MPQTFGSTTVVMCPDTAKSNAHYAGNRAPLLPSPFIKLPLTAIRPEGWLRKQLELQAVGFHGHLEEVSRFMRATVGYRRQGGQWQVIHEHWSAPFDMETQKALFDLKP